MRRPERPSTSKNRRSPHQSAAFEAADSFPPRGSHGLGNHPAYPSQSAVPRTAASSPQGGSREGSVVTSANGKLSIINTFSAVLAKFPLVSPQKFPAVRASVKQEMGNETGTGNAGTCDKKRFV